MKNELEQKICRAFTHAAPAGDPAALLARAGERGSACPTAAPRKTVPILRRVSALAAAFALVIGIGAACYAYDVNFSVDTTVSLDVNPSIALKANQKERVLAADALNAEGAAVLDGMALDGLSLDAAVNALVDAMLAQGYLASDDGAILLSIAGRDAARAASVEANLTAALAETKVTVTAQTIKISDELQALADAHGITAGKAQLVSDMLAEHPEYTFAELAGMNIKQLHYIKRGLAPEAPAEFAATITEAEARAIALAHTVERMAAYKRAFDPNGISSYSSTLERQDNADVYFCYFENETHYFSVRINAMTGEIYSFNSTNWFISREAKGLREVFLAAALADAGLAADEAVAVSYGLRDIRTDSDIDEEQMHVYFYDRAETTYYTYTFGMRSQTMYQAEQRDFLPSDDAEAKELKHWMNTTGVTAVTDGLSYTKEEIYARTLEAALADLGLQESEITPVETLYVVCIPKHLVEGKSPMCGYVLFDHNGTRYAYYCNIFNDFAIFYRESGPSPAAELMYGENGMLLEESAVAAALASKGYTAETVTVISTGETQRDGVSCTQVKFFDQYRIYTYTIDVDNKSGEIRASERKQFKQMDDPVYCAAQREKLDAVKARFKSSAAIKDEALSAALADLGLTRAEVVVTQQKTVYRVNDGSLRAVIAVAVGGSRYTYTCDVLNGFAIIDKDITPIG